MLLNVLYRLTGNGAPQYSANGIYHTSKYISRKYLIKRYIHVHENVTSFSCTSGREHLQDKKINKGLGFSLEERFALGIHGLLPATVRSMESQVEVAKIKLDGFTQNINKYLFLMDLHESNEILFYRVLVDHLEELLPIVYTPTVGEACQSFGLIYRKLDALFVTINDKGHVYDVIKNWPEPCVRAIVVTDGERILGLGDLGVSGVCIPVGKMCLFTALASVKPHYCMPAILDVGTNNEKLLSDPLYMGLRRKRAAGQEYDDFIDEFLQAVVKRFGQMTLVQFEDFANQNAFRLLDKYKDKYCVFNDDIQGTAGIVTAGLLSSRRVLNKKLSDHKYLFLGAGGASVGVANLLVKIMNEQEGLNIEAAKNLIWMFDVNGLLSKNRVESLDKRQAVYAKDYSPSKSFLEIVQEIQPSVLIGASTAGGTFTPDVLKAMATFNERPIIFALSNPTQQSECTAEEAYNYTKGRALYASGSPYPNVVYNDQLYKPRQANNSYIFPSVALGTIMSGIRLLNDDVIIMAAQTVSDLVTDEDLKYGSLYPALTTIRELSVNIAAKIFQYACDKGISSVYPEPRDKEAYIRSYLYNFNYEQTLPRSWVYPRPPSIRMRPIR